MLISSQSSSQSYPPKSLRIAVSGCQHGSLEALYNSLASSSVDLLICCGDFQAVRNMQDLECMSCPPRYRFMQSFFKYYSGEKSAPTPTIFVGGNHEATNYLKSLFYGGWVAPNVYFLGSSGVVNFGGLRIAGVSGIFKGYDFRTGYWEQAPFSEDALKSAHHQREFDFWRLQHLSVRSQIDICMSHDWPEGIYNHGDKAGLLRRKKHFEEDIARSSLGSPPSMRLLESLRPRFWFAGHLHVKFAALVRHPGHEWDTRFLALDKPLPGRDFIQILDIPIRPDIPGTGRNCFAYDPEWLAVVSVTNALTPPSKRTERFPAPAFPTTLEVSSVVQRLRQAGLTALDTTGREFFPIPFNFQPTAATYQSSGPSDSGAYVSTSMPESEGNPQTDAFLSLLGLDHIVTRPSHKQKQTEAESVNNSNFDSNEVDLE
jgi:lariat debranching enzyme